MPPKGSGQSSCPNGCWPDALQTVSHLTTCVQILGCICWAGHVASSTGLSVWRGGTPRCEEEAWASVM